MVMSDIGEEPSLNHVGNTHGSLVHINGQWYVFHHRQTNQDNFSRQGTAEKITILPNGTIPQVECTSAGLNNGPLEGKGIYPTYIACNIFNEDFERMTGDDEAEQKDYAKDTRAFLTQDGGDRESGASQYITNWQDKGVVGFKYFNLNNTKKIIVSVQGNGNGCVYVYTKLDENDTLKEKAAEITIHSTQGFEDFSSEFFSEGIKALYFVYRGEGTFKFDSFTLE